MEDEIHPNAIGHCLLPALTLLVLSAKGTPELGSQDSHC